VRFFTGNGAPSGGRPESITVLLFILMSVSQIRPEVIIIKTMNIGLNHFI
jgi:hypothetical protein